MSLDVKIGYKSCSAFMHCGQYSEICHEVHLNNYSKHFFHFTLKHIQLNSIADDAIYRTIEELT